MSRRCALGISGSKGQGHNALITENGLCHIIPFHLHLLSWNFKQRLPTTRRSALSILGSKDQRSRSQCIYNWKWFMSHNSFPFTPIIMKLLTKTPHEWRMCPKDFGVKRLKVKVTMQLMSHYCFPFTSIMMNLQTKTLHESRICPLGFRVKRSKVNVTMNW